MLLMWCLFIMTWYRPWVDSWIFLILIEAGAKPPNKIDVWQKRAPARECYVETFWYTESRHALNLHIVEIFAIDLAVVDSKKFSVADILFNLISSICKFVSLFMEDNWQRETGFILLNIFQNNHKLWFILAQIFNSIFM